MAHVIPYEQEVLAYLEAQRSERMHGDAVTEELFSKSPLNYEVTLSNMVSDSRLSRYYFPGIPLLIINLITSFASSRRSQSKKPEN
jgi:hypothetical protein